MALETIETIQQQHLEFREMQVDDDKAGRTRQIRISNALRSQHGILKALMNRCESNTQRVQNEIALVRRNAPLPLVLVKCDEHMFAYVFFVFMTKVPRF